MELAGRAWPTAFILVHMPCCNLLLPSSLAVSQGMRVCGLEVDHHVVDDVLSDPALHGKLASLEPYSETAGEEFYNLAQSRITSLR